MNPQEKKPRAKKTKSVAKEASSEFKAAEPTTQTEVKQETISHQEEIKKVFSEDVKKSEKKNTNPLFLITNKGQDVEMLDKIWDFFKKPRSWQDWIQATGSLMTFIKEYLKGMLYLQFLLSWLDQWMVQMKIVKDNMKTFLGMTLPKASTFFQSSQTAT
jgi:hypothetical protein